MERNIILFGEGIHSKKENGNDISFSFVKALIDSNEFKTFAKVVDRQIK